MKREIRQRLFGAGKPANSAKIRQLSGNPGNRTFTSEPDVPACDDEQLVTPLFSSELAHEFYRKFVPAMRKWFALTKADEPNLILLAETWGRVMNYVIETRLEDKDFCKMCAQFLLLAQRFGMTPADRARLIVQTNPEKATTTASKTSTLDGVWTRDAEIGLMTQPQ
jgi:phage terminase small subunit